MDMENDRFSNLMNKPDPLVSRVIHGHLLMEELLNKIIEQRLHHSEFLSGSDLNCHRKIKLVKSLCYDDSYEKIGILLSF